MGIIIRQSVITTLLLYIGAVLGYVNILYLFPRLMSLQEVGIVRTIQDMAAIFVPIAQFGLTHSLIRFFPKTIKHESHRKSLLGLMFLLSLGGFTLFILLFWLFKAYIIAYFTPNAQEIVAYIPQVLVVTFLLVAFNLLAAYAQSLLRVATATFVKDVLFRFLTTLALLMYFQGWLDFNEFITALILAYASMALYLLGYLTFRKEIGFNFDFSFIKTSDLSALLVFALFSLLGTSGMLIIGKIDSIMVTGMLGTSLNGIYTTVFYIAVVIEFPKRAINQISLPLVSRSFENGNLKEIDRLYKQSSVNQLLIGGLLFAGICANLDNIFRLMPNGQAFEAGKWVIVYIGLGRLLDMVAGINSEIIVMSRYYRFNMILLALLAAFTIIFNLIFIPTLGIDGAALGSALSLVLFNIAKFIFLYYKMQIQPFSKGTFSSVLLVAMSLATGLLLPQLDNVYLDIVYRSSAVTVCFALLITWLKPSDEIQGLVVRYLPFLERKK